MDFKNMLSRLSQLNESKDSEVLAEREFHDRDEFDKRAEVGDTYKKGNMTVTKTKGGTHVKHKSDYETDDEDDGKKKEEPAVKRGRGRPKKGADETGSVKTYKGAKQAQDVMIGKLPKGKLPGKPGKKHSLKEWVEEIENKYVAETVPMGMKPLAIMDPKNQSAGAGVLTSTNPAIQKMLGGIDPRDVKIVMTTQQGSTQAKSGATGQQPTATAGGATNQPAMAEEGDYSAKKARAGKDIGKPGKQFAKIAKGAAERYGSKERGEKVAGAVLAKLRSKQDMSEGDTNQNSAIDSAKIAKELSRAAQDIDYELKIRPQGMMSKIFRPGADNRQKLKDAYVWLAKAFAQGASEGAELFKMMKKNPRPEYSQFRDVADDILIAMKKNGIDLAQMIKEGDIPSVQGIDTLGAGLGAGRSDTTLEAKKAKPDFLDIDKDGNKKESMKKAAKDKKKVDESMDNKLKAARHTGKAHALSKQGYNCHYDDMEEARMYHDGYKEGLDECYGQMPIVGAVVDETDMVPATVSGMADQAESIVDETDMEEGNAFTAALARTPKGGKFSVGGKTFTDRTSYDAKVDETMFESWDNELKSLLEEYDQIEEGLTVSISKGQQGSPDSVSVTAQDQEADELLGLIKSAGLGLFGNDQAQQGPMTVDTGTPDHKDIDVVGDHDGMMALIKKVTGSAGEPDTVAIGTDHDDEDYKDEEGNEGVCDACGSAECRCDHEEQVDEVESEDQMAYQVAEDNPPDSGAAEEEEEIQDTAQANQSAAETEIDESEEEEEETELDEGLGKMSRDMLAAASDRAAKGPKRLHPMYSAKVGGQELLAKHKKEGKVEYVPDMSKMKKEETVDESAQLDEWANEAGQKGTDAQFETDIAFMTKVIAGGLNKEKATGQTTIPVIAGQNDRMGYNNVNESIIDFKKLAGIK